jgi:hypothetical protein
MAYASSVRKNLYSLWLKFLDLHSSDTGEEMGIHRDSTPAIHG